MDQNTSSSSVEQLFDEANQYFPTQIQLFQYMDKYSRFDYEKARRETWIETVDRAVEYLKELSKNKLPDATYNRLRSYILGMKATPSMRLLAMAGDAARRQNIAIYNCSYLPLDSIDSFVEELIVAMAGCGVGYSVERRYVDKLPSVRPQTEKIVETYVIPDSTEGWAEALRKGMLTWFDGNDIEFDYSQIRRAGAPLKIKGGRASGPTPLRELLSFTRKIIVRRQGEKLRPIDAHDIACKIGECVVSGAVRRSALIALFDFDDDEMRNCKNGSKIYGNEQRWNANNSAVWEHEMSQKDILLQMAEMIDGERGEPGIFSRRNASLLRPKRREDAAWGTNPCGEINLRPYEFCNLTIAIARENDTLKSLTEKVEVATIIGTIQSMATNFPGLRPIWKKNCEEERLLGVDINGELDCPLLRPSNRNAGKNFRLLRAVAVRTNKKYAKLLGINQSASVTCVKPSGNSSQLFNCSSGLHPRWSQYYIRNIRVNTHVPLFKLLQDQGIPMDPENGQSKEEASSYVIHFPVKAPPGAIVKNDMSAIDQCEYWLINKKNWTEHNPSVTISYKKDEVIDLIKWVWKHRDWIGGMSFLPATDALYEQMPYQEITKEEYEKLAVAFPNIDFSKLHEYEHKDYTTVAMELACIGKDSCELDFIDNGISVS